MTSSDDAGFYVLIEGEAYAVGTARADARARAAMRSAGIAETVIWAGSPESPDARVTDRLVLFRASPQHTIPMTGEELREAMPDELLLREPQDRTRINLGDVMERRWWCEHLGCTESRLRVAVMFVGVMARNVRDYLDRRAMARELERRNADSVDLTRAG